MLNLDRTGISHSTNSKQVASENKEEAEEEAQENTLIQRRVQLSNQFLQGIQTIRKWVVYIITIVIIILFARSLLLPSNAGNESDRLTVLINQLMQLQSSIQPISEQPTSSLYNESETF